MGAGRGGPGGEDRCRRWPIQPPDALDAIRYGIGEIGGHSEADLGLVVGSRQRASDILTGKRSLTM